MSAGQGGSEAPTGTVADIVDRLGERSGEIIGAIQQHLATEIGELRGDPQLLELLGASVAGNVETVLDAVRYSIDIERVEPPTAALEYARRTAQHGVPVTALVRAYRLGHQQMLDHVLTEIRRAGLEPGRALVAFETISGVTFRYIDWISQQVIDAYEAERERWVENRNSVRAVRVRELLEMAEGQLGQLDIDAASTAVRYPLRRTHLALILWTDSDDTSGGELLRLERFVRELAEGMDLPDGALFVAADRVSAHGWLALPAAQADAAVARVRRFVADGVDPPRLSVGKPLAGLSGFRRSHRLARIAQRISVAGDSGRRFTAADEPGLVATAMLAEDLGQTREWVWEALGALAGNTDSDARLRDTLRVFLGEGGSYKAAAERLNLHHNSVRYRVERAIDRRGRPIGEDRIDVELALLACHHFGGAVLAGPQIGVAQ